MVEDYRKERKVFAKGVKEENDIIFFAIFALTFTSLRLSSEQVAKLFQVAARSPNKKGQTMVFDLEPVSMEVRLLLRGAVLVELLAQVVILGNE
jgi:hypothetical protein